jgi:PAS domain S-box-containing protein
LPFEERQPHTSPEPERQIEEEITRYEAEHSISTLNTILSATSEFVYLIDKHGRYRFASERAADLLGLQQRDFLGKTWQEIGMSAEFIAPFEAKRQQVMKTGQAIMDEILFPVAIGMRWFEYAVHPVLDQEGVVTSVVVSSKDITEHKRATDTLHRLASIVESSSEAIVSKTLEGVITSWNKAAEQLFGYRADEIIGQHVSRLASPEMQKEQKSLAAQIIRGNRFKDYETKRLKKDGTPIDMAITISPLLDAQGQIVGMSTIAHDIAERKRMFQELMALNVALQNANQARSQFLATMSHELRTPLASIIGFSEMLLEDMIEGEVGQQQRENLERILDNSEHLLELINDVLDLSKIEAGRMPLDYRQVKVPELLSLVTKQIQSLAVAHNLDLRAEVGEGVSTLETDQRKLHQILLNLLSNAIKFTEQGAVILSTARISLPDQREGIAFTVMDTGIGISPDVQKHIFEPFYQADMSYTRKVGGTGLGLAIVSQLTTLLGGSISLKSTPEGSSFTVMLPLSLDHDYNEQSIPRSI